MVEERKTRDQRAGHKGMGEDAFIVSYFLGHTLHTGFYIFFFHAEGAGKRKVPEDRKVNLSF